MNESADFYIVPINRSEQNPNLW